MDPSSGQDKTRGLLGQVRGSATIGNPIFVYGKQQKTLGIGGRRLGMPHIRISRLNLRDGILTIKKRVKGVWADDVDVAERGEARRKVGLDDEEGRWDGGGVRGSKGVKRAAGVAHLARWRQNLYGEGSRTQPIPWFGIASQTLDWQGQNKIVSAIDLGAHFPTFFPLRRGGRMNLKAAADCTFKEELTKRPDQGVGNRKGFTLWGCKPSDGSMASTLMSLTSVEEGGGGVRGR
ncbi:hypothetical protein NE237_014497 [Protea cynaroides]|uniref:Uncharacterized protein n=1 Tax=Protea cynaroides TaxID=273540 RepID=A0A9Q0KC72_9MAGN|nr:hypothetical protein NE237_014497 [Protea cynaroides]